jgi:ABC-type multidrug transport system fused ATPase/permease subunit
MIDTFLKLFSLLTRKQKRELYLMQLIILMSAVSELVSTVSIMPFIALAANPDIIESNKYFAWVYHLMGTPGHDIFLMYLGLAFIALVTFSNGIMLADQFLMNRYSFRLGGEISSKLYGYYLAKDIVYHSVTNSATMIQRVMRDSTLLSTALIAPALRLNARVFSIFLLASLIVFVDPLVALVTIVVLGAVYWFIFYVIRGAIYRNGKLVSELGQQRNRLLNESFGGIKDMKLYSTEATYLSEYRSSTKASNRASANNMILGESPYYIVETVVFAGMVLLTMYLYASEGGMHAALPLLTLYGMAGMKIVPKLQQSYQAITKIRGAQAAFNLVYADLKAASKLAPFEDTAVEPLRPKSTIELKDISYGYKIDSKPVFADFSAKFIVGETTAIVGASGVGKSTLLDILMGLVEPQAGGIFIDGERVTDEMLAAWRAAIGYVPQEVYLTDTTPAANIAFGVDENDIDMDRVIEAARAAKIHDFIESLPDKYRSPIGERGAQFSGGQRQRIGLARAFYRRVSVLVLDEATSALDSETQADILENLKSVAGTETIIMVTHRSETVAFADRVIRVLASDQQNP